jgi:hypothetical protein
MTRKSKTLDHAHVEAVCYRANKEISGGPANPIFHLLSVHSSLRQPLVGQALVRSRFNEAIKAVQSVALHVPVIQSECELVNVAAKMLMTYLVVDTSKAALQNRPNALNSIHRDLIAHELADAMVDRIVIEKERSEVGVHWRVVGINRGAILNLTVDRSVKIGCICIICRAV